MRTLVALTVLMLALAGAVWWKTTDTGQPDELPGTSSNDPSEGIMTVGLPGDPGSPENASGTGEGGTPANANLAGSGSGTGTIPTPPPGPEPRVDPGAASASQPLRHVVRDGETLYRIVLNAYGTAPAELVQKVADANGLRDPGSIDVDDPLVLPVFAGYPEPSAG